MQISTLQDNREAIDVSALWGPNKWKQHIFDAEKIRKLRRVLEEKKGNPTLLEIYKEVLRTQMLRHAFLLRQIDTTLYWTPVKKLIQFWKTRIAKVNPHFIIEGDGENKYREIEEQLVALHELFCKYWEKAEIELWTNTHKNTSQKPSHGAGKRITDSIFTGGVPYKAAINQGVNIGDWFIKELTKIEEELYQYQALEVEKQDTEGLQLIINRFNKIFHIISYLNTEYQDRELAHKYAAQIQKIHGLITILDKNNTNTDLAESIPA